ncbi:MAG: phosphatase PAP2 family protein [Clostridia bacterium]|nr:phosphatase PAP2 family protein [Clostridia bacterium]
MEFEIKIIEFLQSRRTPFFDIAFQIISAVGSVVGVVALAIFFLVFKKKMCFWYLFTYGFVYLAVSILKLCVARTRPFNASDTIFNVGDAVSDYSFPSGHCACATAIAMFVCYFLLGNCKTKAMKVWTILFGFVFVGLVCLSRMYLGKHYLTDVLAGVTVSAVICMLGIMFMRYVQKKKRNKE